MNTANLESSMVSEVLFSDCLNSSASYKKALNSYYNIIIKSKIALHREIYAEAKHIINHNWKDISTFICYVSKRTSLSVKSVLEFLKNPSIVKFLHYVKWSFKELFRLVKKGYKSWKIFVELIEEYKQENKIKRWDLKEYSVFEKWILSNSKISVFNTESVAGMLVYVWLNMSFVTNIDWELDVSDVIMAFQGTYSMENMLSSNDGINFVVTMSLMPIKFNFLYDNSVNIQFITSTIGVIAKKFGIMLRETTANEIKSEIKYLEI